MPSSPVFVLGGYQTDFARNATREGRTLGDLLTEATLGALARCGVEPHEVPSAHVGNFVGERFTGQAHLGGLFVEAHPGFDGVAAARHEAACASGSIAALAACAELEAGRYELSCVAGVELLRSEPAAEAQAKLAAAAYVPRETEGVRYVWPTLFSAVGDAYARRYGLRDEHLRALARGAFENAQRNPRAQTRGWQLRDAMFEADDAANPVVAGRLRRHDCSPVSDGAAAVVLASEGYARRWAQRRGVALEALPRIAGWGHRTSRLALDDKLRASEGQPYVLPSVRAAITDAYRRAGIAGPDELDAIEAHDCFSVTAYLAIDHFGLTPPGESFRAVDDGRVFFGGALPLNPSGGLLGGGHPVGATGVRMLLDAALQVRGEAGAYQVEGARRVATLNLGGSGTTSVCFVVEAG